MPCSRTLAQSKKNPWIAGGSDPGVRGYIGAGQRKLGNVRPGFRLHSQNHGLENVNVPAVANAESQSGRRLAQERAGKRNTNLRECHAQDHPHTEPGLEIQGCCGAGGQTAGGICGHHELECAAQSLRRLWYLRVIFERLRQYPLFLVPVYAAPRASTKVGLQSAMSAGQHSSALPAASSAHNEG